MSERLTHLDEQGHAHMVDVGEKPVTRRECVARAEIHMAPETLARIAEGRIPKGDVLATARLAGIQAAKRTHEWIPLAHPLPLDSVEVSLIPDPEGACVADRGDGARPLAHRGRDGGARGGLGCRPDRSTTCARPSTGACSSMASGSCARAAARVGTGRATRPRARVGGTRAGAREGDRHDDRRGGGRMSGDDPTKSPSPMEPDARFRGHLPRRRASMTYEMVEQGALVSNRAAPGCRSRGDESSTIPMPSSSPPGRKGDDGAFEELVRRHEKRVFRLLLRMMGSREEAEDVAQETFISLYRHGKRFRAEARFSTFVYRVAANAAPQPPPVARPRAHPDREARRAPGRRRRPAAAAARSRGQHARQRADGNTCATRSGRCRRRCGCPSSSTTSRGSRTARSPRSSGVAEGTVKSRIHRARQALREELRGLLPGTPEGASIVEPHGRTQADGGLPRGRSAPRQARPLRRPPRRLRGVPAPRSASCGHDPRPAAPACPTSSRRRMLAADVMRRIRLRARAGRRSATRIRVRFFSELASPGIAIPAARCSPPSCSP